MAAESDLDTIKNTARKLEGIPLDTHTHTHESFSFEQRFNYELSFVLYQLILAT